MIAHSSRREWRRTWTEGRLTGRLLCPEACTFTTSGDRPQALTAHFGDRRPRRETAVYRVLRLRQGSSMVASPQAVENNRTRTRAFLKRVGWAALAARRGCRVCRVHVSGRAPETRMPRVPIACGSQSTDAPAVADTCRHPREPQGKIELPGSSDFLPSTTRLCASMICCTTTASDPTRPVPISLLSVYRDWQAG